MKYPAIVNFNIPPALIAASTIKYYPEIPRLFLVQFLIWRLRIVNK